MPRKLRADQVAAIEGCWREGLNVSDAKRRTGISRWAIDKQYIRCELTRVPRDVPQPKKILRPKLKGLPIYDGPDWIG